MTPFKANIRVLGQHFVSHRGTKLDGPIIPITVSICLDKDCINYEFGAPDRNYLLYLAGLVETTWDSSKFILNNPDLPAFKFEYSFTERGVPASVMQTSLTYKGVTNLSKSDKKLQKAKQIVCDELIESCCRELGFGPFSSHKFDKCHIDAIEGSILQYVQALRMWRDAKTKAAAKAQQDALSKDAELKEVCLKFLTERGFKRESISVFDSSMLRAQVEGFLIEEYKSNPANEYSADKQYDDGGRYWEYPTVSYCNGEFQVSLNKEYY